MVRPAQRRMAGTVDLAQSVTAATAADRLPPDEGALARRYAGALYDLAAERRLLDETIDQMTALGRLIDESADLRRLLGSPLVRADEARHGLDAALRSQGFGELVRHLVGVVAANRRLTRLRAIVSAFAALAATRRGVTTAEVTTAHGLDDVQRAQLSARLAESGYPQVRLVERVDPAILGGLVLRVGARLYDASIKSRLQRLAFRMKEAA